MSATAEETSIAGISSGLPQCEILLAPDYETQCSHPAVKRIRYFCGYCGHRNCIFVCRECFDDFVSSGVDCHGCLRPSGLRWTEI